MSDIERETYLHEIRAEAWVAFMQTPGGGADEGKAFAAVAEVYERELRMHLSVDEESDHDYAEEMRAVSRARDLAYEELDSTGADRIQSIIAELDKVLGPDLVREADPTGKFLKGLPFEQRKQMLDALDSGAKIIIVEDEMGPILEQARQMRERADAPRPIEVLEPVNLRRLTRDEVAERLSDYLTQLGIDPDETFEGDTRTTAQILADVALATDGTTAVEVGSPEHQVAERVQVAEMSRRDVARGEG